jgi:DNA replication ATP-dependent helicase Dna2
MGLEDNIFAMYPEPEFSCSLSIQYRMSQHIMRLANELLYGNKMQCGSDNQAFECLRLPQEKVKKYLMSSVRKNEERKWLCLAASWKPQRCVLFFDTSDISAYEKIVSSAVQNEREKDITLAVVKMLVNVRCSLSMCYYSWNFVNNMTISNIGIDVCILVGACFG